MLGGGLARAVAALVALALVAVACGDGAGDGESGGREPVGETENLVVEPEPSSGAEPPQEPEAPPEPSPSPEPAVAPEPPLPEPTPPPEPSAGEGAQELEPPGETAVGEQPDELAETPEEPAEPAADGPPEAPEPDAGGAGVRGTLEFTDCGQEYLCGTLAVPADHADPGGPTVELAVGMLPAGDPSRRVGYLLTNPGGPGGGIQGFLDFGAGLSPYVLERFDVVGWDPRAVGGSVPSSCWAEAVELHLLDPVPDSPAEREALDSAARAVADECVTGLGDMVGRIGTIDTVRDMDAIRRALGAETISYIGFSYGTLLGLLYADLFGEHLRAAVLDGVSDPSLSGLEHAVGQIVGFDRSIQDMFAWCRSDPGCAVTGDPADTYYGLLDQVDEAPLTGPAGELVLDPGRVVLAAVLATYSSQLWPFFFQFLAEATAGDGSMLAQLGEGYTLLADLGAFVAINCADGGAVTRDEIDVLADALEDVAGVFGRASLVSILPCEYWPVEVGTRPVGPVAAPLAPPILVVGNRGDNATPYEWAVSVAEQLESGVLISYDGSEHTSYGLSRCVTGIVDEYLVNLIVPPEDMDCPRES